MKASATILLATSLFWLSISSCAFHRAAKPAKPTVENKKKPQEEPALVGRIASIPPDKRFVLIQSYGKWSIEAGRILTTRGPDERSANLLTTGESLGEFAAADLQSGHLEVGDAVYSRNTTTSATVDPTSEPPQHQSPEASGGFPKNN